MDHQYAPPGGKVRQTVQAAAYLHNLCYSGANQQTTVSIMTQLHLPMAMHWLYNKCLKHF